MDFINWFLNIHMPADVDWILMGDFNLMRAPSDRNRPGGDVNDMLLFNEAISNQGLIELPLQGIKFSWSNMQQDPLLVKLDWFFTSASWLPSFPNPIVFPLAKPISDHLPCVIKIGTAIPKARVFRFENYWLQHSDFKEVVAAAWSIPVGNLDVVKSLNAKFKNLRRALKLWAKSLSCLRAQIAKLNELIFLWDFFEEFRELEIHEWNCRAILKDQLLLLLRNQKIYWKQRGKIKGVKFGDENTKIFHTKASINHRHNHIAVLQNDDQVEISDHAGKAAILWESYKKRMGTSHKTTMHFDLESLFGPRQDQAIFDNLELPFTEEEINAVVKDLPLDKSPGPDGFNNEFFKSCWDIIKVDVFRFIQDFHAGQISIESLNTSYITLIPKGSTPLTANDFRPISLLN